MTDMWSNNGDDAHGGDEFEDVVKAFHNVAEDDILDQESDSSPQFRNNVIVTDLPDPVADGGPCDCPNEVLGPDDSQQVFNSPGGKIPFDKETSGFEMNDHIFTIHNHHDSSDLPKDKRTDTLSQPIDLNSSPTVTWRNLTRLIQWAY
ncbi:hypothetical protein L1887_11576 [Cichorium endivia]|nr:hypothetical protein L1887_11576 [Cichorium endivia]